MKFMTTGEAARHFNISAQDVRRGANDGRYPHMCIGGQIVVDVDAMAPILEAERVLKSQMNIIALSEVIGLSDSAIRRGIREGWLPHMVVGRGYRFVLEDVQQALANRVTVCTESAEKKTES